MADEPTGGRAQDAGRAHRRARRRIEARPLGPGDRLAVLERTPLEAYRAAIEAAAWLYAADELAIVILRDVLAQLEPAQPAGESVLGGPLPVVQAPLADRLKLWTLALQLAGELGLTAESRRTIGLELTPPDPSPTGPATSRGPARRRRLDFGGA
jgi:hypothetical protein